MHLIQIPEAQRWKSNLQTVMGGKKGGAYYGFNMGQIQEMFVSNTSTQSTGGD